MTNTRVMGNTKYSARVELEHLDLRAHERVSFTVILLYSTGTETPYSTYLHYIMITLI